MTEQPHPLTLPNYRKLWIGQAISTFGDRFTTIAIPILVYEVTGSSLQLGLAFMLQAVASLLFGLWAGAMSDRWNRQWTLMGSDMVRALLVLFVPLAMGLPISTTLKLIIVYTLGFLIAAVGRFHTPAKLSLIPQLVSKDRLVDANAWDQGTTTFTQFGGYTLAGILIASTNVQTAFYIDAATFLVSAVFVSQLQLSEEAKFAQLGTQTQSVLQSIKTGITQAFTEPLTRAALIVMTIIPLAFGGLQPLLLVFSEQILESETVGFGLLNGVMALGAALGFIVCTRLIRNRHRGYLLSYGAFLFGVFQLLGIAVPVLFRSGPRYDKLISSTGGLEISTVLLLITLPFFLLTSMANSALVLGVQTIIQEASPSAMIGRVSSVFGVMANAGVALGAATTGLADVYGVGRVMMAWCVMVIVVGVAALMAPIFRASALPTLAVTQD